MTDVAAPPALQHTNHGLIGNRELVCVQTIEIGRLRSAPVPLTAGTFVAVSGRGPKGDSNGSGKTTFLAAVSLLHGEVGWHLATGAAEAASLLFDGTKAGVDVQRYARADHGYVVGVFRSAGLDDPITVWLRINAAAPVLKVRAKAGIHLVQAPTSTARAATADAVWAELPKPEWGSRSYPEALYGTAPRCMAWLQARGNETPGKSLLKLSQEMLEPEQIGTALLELLGRDDLLEEDRAARSDLDTTTREVDDLLAHDTARRLAEDDDLKAIAGRNQAREHLARAERLWRLHYAKGLVDAVVEVNDARSRIRPAGASRRIARQQLRVTGAALGDIGDGSGLKTAAAAAAEQLAGALEQLQQATSAKAVAQAALSDRLTRVEDLSIAAAVWDGTPLADLEADETAAALSVEASSAELAVIAAERERCERELSLAEAGAGGTAGATAGRLAATVPAVPLLDDIELDQTARPVWEPRLALFRDAVAVAAGDHDDAVAAATAGDVIVAGDSDRLPLPDGILAAPPAAVPFLTWLATAPAQDGCSLHGEHVTVVGGFTDPITGREARIAAARRAVEDSRTAETNAQEKLAAAREQLTAASERVGAARADAELAAARVTLAELRQRINDLDAAETRAALEHRRQTTVQREADEAWGGYAEKSGRLEEAKERHERTLEATTNALRDAIDTYRRQRGRVPYWAHRWGGDQASATVALNADAADHPSGEDRSSSAAYRRAANHAIDRALMSCGIDSSSGDGAPAGSGVDLAVSERLAAGNPADDDEAGQSYERKASAFHAVADALDAWLGRLRVEDSASAAHIEADRERRTKALVAAQELCDKRRRELPILQDQIERLLRTSLKAVSDKLNALDLDAKGAGADLLIEPLRPATAKENWQWRVTPRYRRGPNGALVPYTERANTATEKLLAIHLVLAALFAATAERGADNGRLLILDELGDSLGDYHREAVLQALARTASDSGITVFGTCQDGVLEDAARHCGLLLYFQFRDPSDILNAPTRVFGTTHDGAVVEQTGPWIARLG
jgi:hypothetical protein